MRKRVIMAAVVCGVVLASMVSGCGKKGAPTAPADNAVTTEATTAQEQGATDDYLSWTGKEWKNASAEEKEAASKFYLVESIKVTAEAAGQDVGSMVEAAVTPEAVTANVAVLDAAFSADESMKLKDLLDMTTDAASAMMDVAMPQTP